MGTLLKTISYKHPYFEQKGFFMILDISELSNGSHYLKIQLNSQFPLDDIGRHLLNEDKNMFLHTSSSFDYNYDDQYSINIPFYNNRR